MMSIVTGFLTSLVELVAALGDLSFALKVAWIVVAVWAAVQVWLLRKLRVHAPTTDVTPAKAPRRARAPRKKKPAIATVAASAREAVASIDSPHGIALPADTVYR